jgi:putative sigma-54 modulation protein
MYAAIDVLVDKVDRQIIKHKSKVQAHPHEALKHLPEEQAPEEQA